MHIAVVDPTVTISVIGAIQAIIVTILGAVFHGETKRRKKKDDENDSRNKEFDRRSKIRAEESLLAMKLMSASMSLSIATGIAVKEGKINGKMTAAIEEGEKAQRDYYDFINRIASTQMTEH